MKIQQTPNAKLQPNLREEKSNDRVAFENKENL